MSSRRSPSQDEFRDHDRRHHDLRLDYPPARRRSTDRDPKRRGRAQYVSRLLAGRRQFISDGLARAWICADFAGRAILDRSSTQPGLVIAQEAVRSTEGPASARLGWERRSSSDARYGHSEIESTHPCLVAPSPDGPEKGR